MIAFNSLAILALISFIAHVVLLFTSFGKKGYQKKRYFYSHVTLWVAGALVFLMATLFSGTNTSSVLDVFDTPGKQLLILALVIVLSFTAHTIVRLLIMPKYQLGSK